VIWEYDALGFRLLSGIRRISHGLSPILCHGRVLYVDVKADSFGVRFVEPCDLWQSSIRRALSTPRRNDWGSIRFHVPIDASVDVTDARCAKSLKAEELTGPCLQMDGDGGMTCGCHSTVIP
jgi:hypothetical protein